LKIQKKRESGKFITVVVDGLLCLTAQLRPGSVQMRELAAVALCTAPNGYPLLYLTVCANTHCYKNLP
jgi:hypothetical protein